MQKPLHITLHCIWKCNSIRTISSALRFWVEPQRPLRVISWACFRCFRQIKHCQQRYSNWNQPISIWGKITQLDGEIEILRSISFSIYHFRMPSSYEVKIVRWYANKKAMVGCRLAFVFICVFDFYFTGWNFPLNELIRTCLDRLKRHWAHLRSLNQNRFPGWGWNKNRTNELCTIRIL